MTLMESETIRQTTDVSGNGNAAFSFAQVVGNVQIGGVQVVAESQFFDLDVDQLRTEPWIEPREAGQLVHLLVESRLLMIAGPLDDKVQCARDLAYLLCRRLSESGVTVAVRERWRSKDAQRFDNAFRADAPTILLLPDISKSQVAGGLMKLRSLLESRNGYAIITTEASRAQWDIEEGTSLARVWCELAWESYYGRHELTGYLRRLIEQSPKSVPEALLPSGQDEGLLIQGMPLEQAVERLKCPESARYFANLLLADEATITWESVDSTLAELAGDAGAVSQWYEQLDTRDQLLALGLVLLDGLPDDLLFAGLELLVQSVWRGTDPLLPQFDHHDLSRLAAYFKQSSIEDGFVRVQTVSPDRRRCILEVIWRKQRRRLLAALPALTEMIKASAAEQAAPGAAHHGDPLPSTSERPSVLSPKESSPKAADSGQAAARAALGRNEGSSTHVHQVLLESLSMIGLVSVKVVEPYLLALATDRSASVQHLVAGALAAWRQEQQDEALFKLIGRWWKEACAVNSRSRLARVGRSDSDPWAALRSTVALTVGYAAQYDREDCLAPQLCELLGHLVADQNPRVREAVEQFTLPRAVAWHFCQLEPMLRNQALLQTSCIDPVARGAAAACEMRPDSCVPLLASWSSLSNDNAGSSQQPAAPRENVVATAALAWGFIRCDENQPSLSTASMSTALRQLAIKEMHPFIRHYAFHAIELQTRRNYALAAHLLHSLLAHVSLQDRPAVVSLATRTYLYQRHQMSGGDQNIELEGIRYAVWTISARPATGLEASLYAWISDAGRPIAQQLAVEIFAALGETALEREESRLQTAMAARQAVPVANDNTLPAANAYPLGPQVRNLGVIGRLAIYLALPRQPELRPTLGPLLASLLFERRRNLSGRFRVSSVLGRWATVRDTATNTLSACLRRSVHLYQWRWGIMILVSLICLFAAGATVWIAGEMHQHSETAHPAEQQR